MKKNKKISNKPQTRFRARLRAKLSFDDGFAERPLYSIKAFTNEKGKGINMIDLIRDNFDVSNLDLKEYQKDKFTELTRDFEELEEEKITRTPIKWTRDEKGQIISPFGNKAKELKKLEEIEEKEEVIEDSEKKPFR